MSWRRSSPSILLPTFSGHRPSLIKSEWYKSNRIKSVGQSAYSQAHSIRPITPCLSQPVIYTLWLRLYLLSIRGTQIIQSSLIWETPTAIEVEQNEDEKILGCTYANQTHKLLPGNRMHRAFSPAGLMVVPFHS
ncbi:hypothetical protein WAI453_004952 [Rhynchosporium graminicola]